MNDRNVNPTLSLESYMCITLIHFLLSRNLCTVSSFRHTPGQKNKIKWNKIKFFLHRPAHCTSFCLSFHIFLDRRVFGRHYWEYPVWETLIQFNRLFSCLMLYLTSTNQIAAFIKFSCRGQVRYHFRSCQRTI